MTIKKRSKKLATEIALLISFTEYQRISKCCFKKSFKTISNDVKCINSNPIKKLGTMRYFRYQVISTYSAKPVNQQKNRLD